MVFSVSAYYRICRKWHLLNEKGKGSSFDIYLTHMYQIPVRMQLIAVQTGCGPHMSVSRHDLLYATFILSGVLATFKPYPTLSDPGLFLSLWALFPETYTRACHDS